MKKKLVFKMSMLLLLLTICITTNLFSITACANGEEGSITDVMRGWGTRNKADTEVLNETLSGPLQLIGIITSCIVYIIFAGLAFTTACDLLYIAVPFLRPYLNPSESGSAMGYSSYTREAADRAAQDGNMVKANILNQRANSIEANGSGIAHINEKNGVSKKGFISQELKSILMNKYMSGNVGQDVNFTATTGMNLVNNANRNSILKTYLKRRMFTLVYIGFVIVLLLYSNIFTKTGINIGEAFLRFLGF